MRLPFLDVALQGLGYTLFAIAAQQDLGAFELEAYLEEAPAGRVGIRNEDALVSESHKTMLPPVISPKPSTPTNLHRYSQSHRGGEKPPSTRQIDSALADASGSIMRQIMLYGGDGSPRSSGDRVPVLGAGYEGSNPEGGTLRGHE